MIEYQKKVEDIGATLKKPMIWGYLITNGIALILQMKTDGLIQHFLHRMLHIGCHYLNPQKINQ